MLIGLLNLENKYQNYALEKLRIYYTQKGDIVEDYIPLNYNNYDKIYCSSIFDFTPKLNLPPNAICGGTGFDLTTHLPVEIDQIKLHLNFGYTLRGCCNKCSFCVVWKKEPELKRDGNILDLWDGKSKSITLLDNNALADLLWFKYNCKIAQIHKIILDWNQGLDHRKLTPDVVDVIKETPHKELRFAFDNPESINTVEKAIKLLKNKGINRCNWYVLVGFDTTFERDLFRLNYLRDNGQNAYVQRYHKPSEKQKPEYIALARWANQHHIFQGMTWEQFLKHPDNKNYRKLFI
jgi:hypothetical protein